ncbi:MAG: hypothetical protein H7841_01155 [Magnetospirillum sp. WYHS-4]
MSNFGAFVGNWLMRNKGRKSSDEEVMAFENETQADFEKGFDALLLRAQEKTIGTEKK